MIEGIDHQWGARQCGSEGGGWVEMEAATDDDEQKHEQAQNQRKSREGFFHQARFSSASLHLGDGSSFAVQVWASWLRAIHVL
jgi:hypothetical protein